MKILVLFHFRLQCCISQSTAQPLLHPPVPLVGHGMKLVPAAAQGAWIDYGLPIFGTPLNSVLSSSVESMHRRNIAANMP
jgi:hypothetical protein